MPKLAPALWLFALHQAACSAVISPSPCLEGFDALLNGGFEDRSAWTSDPGHAYFCSSSIVAPPEGMWSACLGTTGSPVETMQQEVTLPEGTTSVAASGSICIATMETENIPHDVLSIDVLVDANPVARLGMFSDRDGGSTCTFKPFQTTRAQLTGAPRVVTLQLRATQDGATLLTSFYLDLVKLTAGCMP